ncbi:MAG: hypothetical protein LBO78_03645, partial [Rickettsiales bacterium]|nr:hypothetical protein [Rickettsiales bacterium]
DGINGRCGREALLAKYEAIALDPIASEDERLLLKENVNTAWGAKTLSSDIATKFANVGSGSWNFSGMAGKFLDTKWDFKSSTYPREIVMLVNAFVTEGETACGKSFRADMQETGFNLDSSLSSLEREIQKNGILKGLFDYGVNQIAAVKGEAWAQEMKEGGLGGIGKKECAYKSDIVVMLSDGKAVPAKIREMISALEIMRDGATNNKSAKNCYNIIYGDLQIIFENYTVTKDGKEKKISDVAPIDGFSGSDSSIDDAIGRLDQIKDASFEPKDAPAKPEEISYNITPVDMEGKEWSEIIRITKEKIEKTNKEFISAINGKTLNPSIDTTDWPTSGSPETAPPG